MRATLIFGILIAVGVAAAWWMLDGAGMDAPGGGSAADRRTPAAAAARTGSPEGEGERALPRARVGGTEGAVEPSPDTPSIAVRVLHADGRPAAGAQVTWCVRDRAWSRSKSEADWLAWARDPVAVLLAEGEAVATTDAHGVASLVSQEPRDERAASSPGEVHALFETSDGTWHAVAQRSWRRLLRETLELRLVADRSLRFRVVDPRGEGVAGVPLEIGAPRRSLGATGANGILETAHVQTWFSHYDEEDRPTGALFVRPDLPGLGAVGVEVNPARAGLDVTHTIRLPATGRVVVELPWLERRPAGGIMGHRVALVPATTEGREERRQACHAEIGEEFRAVFPLVALDQRWRIPRHWPVESEKEFDGPRRPGEEVVVTLEALSKPYVFGRLLHDGEPLTEARVSLSGRSSKEPQQRHTIGNGRSSDDGSFALDLWRSEPGTLWSDLQISALVDAETVHPRAFEADLPATYRPEGRAVDLGEIWVDAVEPLWTGRILEAGTDAPLTEHPRVMACRDTSEGLSRWPDAQVLIANDHVVTVFGPTPPGPCFLSVLANGFLPSEPVPLIPGTRDAVIELQRGGGARLVLSSPDQSLSIGAVARLVPEGGEAQDTLLGPPWTRPGQRSVRKVFDRGRPERPVWLDHESDDAPVRWLLQWSGLPPGRYRLEVGSHGPGTVIERPGVEIVDGTESDLGVLDLEGRLAFTTLRLSVPDDPAFSFDDPDVRRFGLGHLYFGDPISVRPDRMQVDGALTWFASPAPQDVVLEIPGCRRKVVRAAFGEMNVTLERGIPVRMDLGASDIEPEQLRIVLEAGADVELDAGTGDTFSPAAGGAVAQVSRPTTCVARTDGAGLVAYVTEPGTWRLRVDLRNADGDWQALEAASRDLVVPETGHEIAVDLPR